MSDSLIILALLVVVAVVAAFAAYRIGQRRRSAALRERFGPEYGNAVEQYGSVPRAERELLRREAQVKQLDIRPLSRPEQQRYATAWAATQKQFVDDPLGAIRGADALIKEILAVRGYPALEFEERVRSLSVEHGRVVQHYRAARALLADSERGEPNTEELRQAMIHYRALFQDLIETQEAVVVDRPLQQARA
jgi:hypothetical protein